METEETADSHQLGIISGPTVNTTAARLPTEPPASQVVDAPERPPAEDSAVAPNLSPSHPSAAANDPSDEASSYYSSSDEENNPHRDLLVATRNFVEPRVPVLQLIRETLEAGDSTDAAALASFYSRQTTPRERESHRIEDSTRLVYESFDENNIVDRRVNEGKPSNFY